VGAPLKSAYFCLYIGKSTVGNGPFFTAVHSGEKL
jgi:hypothetical protein